MIFPLINNDEYAVIGGVRPLKFQEKKVLVKYLRINRNINFRSKFSRYRKTHISGANTCIKYEVIKSIEKFSDNKVYALDAVTGQELWSFFTGGPIRLAPMVSKGKVFVGSDDGFAYCLNAQNGKLTWKVRGGPNNKQLLGSGKMISRWPIRTGVLVDSDIAYFGAGIFPHENVYLCAVKADDGTVIWKNDSISEQDAYRKEFYRMIRHV